MDFLYLKLELLNQKLYIILVDIVKCVLNK